MPATYASYEATRFIAKGKFSLVYEVTCHLQSQHMPGGSGDGGGMATGKGLG